MLHLMDCKVTVATTSTLIFNLPAGYFKRFLNTLRLLTAKIGVVLQPAALYIY